VQFVKRPPGISENDGTAGRILNTICAQFGQNCTKSAIKTVIRPPVDQVVVGSTPISHPKDLVETRSFLIYYFVWLIRIGKQWTEKLKAMFMISLWMNQTQLCKINCMIVRISNLMYRNTRPFVKEYCAVRCQGIVSLQNNSLPDSIMEK
jgi:hypothetical protein